jgi:hypothetical protein
MLVFAQDKRHLAGRKVAVVSFITRFLAESDKWKVVEFSDGVARREVSLVSDLPVSGVVAAISERPPERSESRISSCSSW